MNTCNKGFWFNLASLMSKMLFKKKKTFRDIIEQNK